MTNQDDEIDQILAKQIAFLMGKKVSDIHPASVAQYCIDEVKQSLLSLRAKWEEEAEDRALDYATKLFDLTGHWPEYYKRHLTGDRYRKDYKNHKVALRGAK